MQRLAQGGVIEPAVARQRVDLAPLGRAGPLDGSLDLVEQGDHVADIARIPRRHQDGKETRTITLGATKEQEEEQRIAEAIIEFLQAKQTAVEERDIDAEVEGRRAIKKRALRLLVEENKVLREGEGKRGSPYQYGLEKSWFSGSPLYTGNQGTRNEKADLTPQEDLLFSGSRDFEQNRHSAKSQEPENGLYSHTKQASWEDDL